MSEQETIAAPATPPGRGGVGVIRISGPQVSHIINKVCGRQLQPRYATLSKFIDADGQTIDEGIALYFPAPHSFTGEDVLELHGHGGAVVMDCLLQRVLTIGARMARPGEFSERAFLNDKIDLTQAEAIADLIDASSVQAARSAIHSLQGEFSAKILSLVEALIKLRMYVEAAIDFPEEEIDFLADSAVQEQLTDIKAQLHTIQGSAERGRLLREGMQVVITGEPNVGKSSLLNRLSGRDSAIVTDIPGTTRDLLREQINIDGLPLHVIDTAGLRETQDIIEKEGVRRAQTAIDSADRILWVVDCQNELKDISRWPSEKLTVIYNKIDLTGKSEEITEQGGVTFIRLSAKTGQGIPMLCQHLKQCMGFEQSTEGNFIARRRHLEALHSAQHHVNKAEVMLEKKSGELVAEELRLAQLTLGEITGEFRTDDLLARIFSDFCIGK